MTPHVGSGSHEARDAAQGPACPGLGHEPVRLAERKPAEIQGFLLVAVDGVREAGDEHVADVVVEVRGLAGANYSLALIGTIDIVLGEVDR